MAADGSMIMLAVIATVLVLYVVQQEKKPGKSVKKPSVPAVGSRKPRASLGKSAACENVNIDSPDFARCSLGSGRSVIRSKPRADNMNRAFKKDNYKLPVSGALGNPFAVKLDDSFTKDTDRKLGAGKAFPFSKSGELPKGGIMRNKINKMSGNNVEHRGHKFNPKRHATNTNKSTRSTTRGPGRAVEDIQNGMDFNNAFLGAAVSPSSASLGASPEEIAQSTNKLDNMNNVASNTGGNLNLLHPL